LVHLLGRAYGLIVSIHCSGLACLAHAQGVRMPSEPPILKQNLPASVSSFIGREQELRDIRQGLREHRLITLTGAGGTGKTRLALEAAASQLNQFADGVWLVEFAGLSTSDLVVQTIAKVLALPEAPDLAPIEQLGAFLQSRRLLLVLDNCEHLIEECARITAFLLARCPRLVVLATSREPLSIDGETILRVPPLHLPDPVQPVKLPSLIGYDAVRLFVERAHAVEPSFQLMAINAAAVVEICRRLDGLPLALEFAAARVKVLGVIQIAERLNHALHLLTRGNTVAPPRHQTLRAMLDWSHDLLPVQAQTVLRRLSVFAGGFTLEAAEAVCASDDIAQPDVLDLLSDLVDKSLVDVERRQVEPRRYRLLETIRQYSQEQLERAGETIPFYLRHTQWCLTLVAGAEEGLRGAEQAAWFEQLEREHDNLRMGFSRASDPAMQLQLASALFYFWSRRGYLSEGRRWLTLALGNAQSLHPTPAHAKALYSAAQLAYLQGDPAAAHSLALQSIAVSKQVDDTQSYAYALTFLGLAAAQQGDSETARSVGAESVACFREVGDAWGLAMALYCLGTTIKEAGKYHLARPLIEESMGLFRMAGDQWGEALVLLGVGSLEFPGRSYGAARAAFEASLTLFQQFGDIWGVNAALYSLGEVALKQQDYATARSRLQAVLSSRSDLGDTRGIAEAFAELAAVARAQGQHRTAATLGGASEALFESIGTRVPAYARANNDNLADLSNEMSENQFATIWAEGRAMTVDQAIQCALALPTVTESTAIQDDDPDVLQQTVQPQLAGLTPREREVVVLVAQGKSNRAIAEALVISEKTAERHVANILSKLGFHSRTQIAAWAVQKGASSMPG
jgi:predicted ATPase/DNA-binding CsgD family transcriptional regulator